MEVEVGVANDRSSEGDKMIMKIAEQKRVAEYKALGTELEQMTRNYASRYEQAEGGQSIIISPDVQSPIKATIEYFDRQIMCLEPQRDLENAQQKLSQPITELLLRALSIFQAASDAGVSGYDDTKMNRVVRARLRQILDFSEEESSNSGAVNTLQSLIPESAPLRDTIEYFNKLEYKQGPESPIKFRLRKYFEKKHGIHIPEKKSYAFIPQLSILEMRIEDIVEISLQKIKHKKRKKAKQRFQDYLSNLLKMEVLTGNTLKMRCMRYEDVTAGTIVSNIEEGVALPKTESSEKNCEQDDNVTFPILSEPNYYIDLSWLLQDPVKMQEDDAWLLLSTIGLKNNSSATQRPAEIKANLNHKKPSSPESSRRNRVEDLQDPGLTVSKRRRKGKKPKPKKSPTQKWSKRKKMRKLRELLDKKEEEARLKKESKYKALHSNTEGEEYKKRAYRPSKARIMLNERNFYDDARLHTRRPGSRASIFEPSLENTDFGKAHGLDFDRDPTRAVNYKFRQPKGILKTLSRFDSKKLTYVPKQYRSDFAQKKPRQGISPYIYKKSKTDIGTEKKSAVGVLRDGSLEEKAKDLIQDKYERMTRFGSLRNLNRALERSRKLRTDVSTIPLEPVANDKMIKVQQSGSLQRNRQHNGYRGSEQKNENQLLNDGFALTEKGVAESPSPGIEPLDLNLLGPPLESKLDEIPDHTESQGLDDFEDLNKDGSEGSNYNEEYDEDYDEYWDEEYDEYDENAEAVNKIESQLRKLQSLYAQRLESNSKGLSQKKGARVPGLPRGFINGQIIMTRTAQRKNDIQNKLVGLFKKKVGNYADNERSQIYAKMDQAKQKKPLPPALIGWIMKLLSRKKKPQLSKDQLMSKLKSRKGKAKLNSGKPGGPGIVSLNASDESTARSSHSVDGGEERVDKSSEESKVAEGASGEENSEKEKNEPEKAIIDEEDQVEVSNKEDLEEPNSLENSDALETVQELQVTAQDLNSGHNEQREKALEAFRHFQLFLDECKKQYSVVSGVEKTHATNFRDVYTEWLSRNRADRRHFGWDPDPPPPPPRKRERPLNTYALKRQQMAKEKKQGIVVIAGKRYSARELFERKRLARRRARPLSLGVKIWRFFF